MGLIGYLPDSVQSAESLSYSEDDQSAALATLGLNKIKKGVEESLQDMRESFKEVEEPLIF